MSASGRGFVYVMRSPAVTWTKIGLSARAPHFRARELSADPVCGALGPWEVIDYRQVEEMRASELALHRHLQARWVPHGSARELFDVPPEVAVAKLIEVAGATLSRGDLIGRLRLEPDLVRYLLRLFRETGLSQFLDLQEAWTLSLFPATAGGREFTINIDRHEVAYAARLRGSDDHVFMLFADALIGDADAAMGWFEARKGEATVTDYRSALDRGVAMTWVGTMADAAGVFDLPFLRRALLAYWYDSLLSMRDRGARSMQARFHNHNAVQELLHLAKEGHGR